MKIVGVKVTSKGIAIEWVHQNSEDDKAFVVGVGFPDKEPKGILKSLKKLTEDAKTISGLSDTAIIDVKGISIKYKENQIGLNISVFHHVNDGSGLGFAYATPFKYDVHENPDFALPEGIMKKVGTIKDEAIKYVKLHFDQMDLVNGA